MSEVPLQVMVTRDGELTMERCTLGGSGQREREFFIDNLLVRIHLIILMIRWTGLAPWEFEFSFPGSLTSTFLVLFLLLQSAESQVMVTRDGELTMERC